MAYTPAWTYDLQPASWRGQRFVVEATRTLTGRRTAIHEYPYRALPWVEDLGPATQEISVQGFLHGDDVASQYKALKAECEGGLYGEFVHPRLGSLTCAIVGCAFAEDKAAGNVVRLSLTFVVTQTESSITLWPVAARSTSRLAGAAALEAGAAGERSFLQRAGDAIRGGQAAVREVVQEAQGYVREAQNVVSDATRALNVVASVPASLGIPGLNFSRYLNPLNSATRVLTQVNSGLATATRVNNATTAVMNSGNRAVARVNDLGGKAVALVNRL